MVQFIDVLEDMGEVEYNEHNLFKTIDDYRICESNVSKFKEYFLKTWVPTNLSIEAENIFYSIPEKVDEINKYLINAINVVGSNNKKRLMSREVDLDIIEKNAEGVRIDRDIYTMVSPNDPRFVKANKISDIFNQPSNYSYGDLLLMLDKYETYFESEHDRKFSNAIKIFYSILLFETMFYRSNSINYSVKKDDTEDINKIDEHELEQRVKKRVNDIIPIQRLIGGTIYYPNYFEIITSKYFKQKGPSYDAKRAFYHKVKEDETDDMPLFSVLYYGDIRPDRYDTKHVYDTTFEHDSVVDSERYKTFDILSIINNMLNPWQTIARADINEIDIGKWHDQINMWREYCKPGESQEEIISFPNSILPFYSVDMMLKYIRKQYDVQEIEENDNDKRDNEYKKEEIVSNWLGLMEYDNVRISFSTVKRFMKEKHRINISFNSKKEYNVHYENPKITDLLMQMGIILCDLSLNPQKVNEIKNNLIEDLIKDKVVIEKEGKYYLSKYDNSYIIKALLSKKIIQLLPYEKEYIVDLQSITQPSAKGLLKKLISIRVVTTGNKIVVYNDSDYKLSKGIEIITEAKKYIKKLTNDDEVNIRGGAGKEYMINKKQLANKEHLTSKEGVCCFRDYAISQIMKLYSGGQREQDMLIKNLYRYNSITEMYRYLVDVLWKDAIIEYGIRQDIQETVHSKDFVVKYYKELFNVTERNLKEIFGEGKQFTNIYKNIFDQAVISFIDEIAQKS